jgi:calcium-dependent protein kinase
MGGCVNSKDREEASKSLLPIAFAPLHHDIRFKYNILKKIGSGRYGTVRLAALKTMLSAQVVIKTILKKRVKVAQETLDREIQLMFKLDHPYIVRLYEVFEDSQNIHLVTEYCSGGGLFEEIVAKGRFQEQEAARLMYKMLLAVNHLHHLNVCHRDLKPENFVFEDTTPSADLKLIDFGISSKIFVDNSEQKTVVGTPNYMAPEVLQGEYGPMCDMWSVGVILYAMLSGQLPFSADTPPEILERARSGDYSVSSEPWKRVSPQAIDLVKKLLNVNPKGRLTAKEALQHEWFSQAPTRFPITLSLIDAFRNYKAKSRFQAEAHYILTKFVNLVHNRDVKDTFMSLSREQTGYLCSDEVNRGLAEAEHVLTTSQLAELIRNVNFKNDGRVSYSDFLASVMIPRGLLDDDMIWCAFVFFDVDNTGSINESNMQEALRRVGREVSQGDVHEMMVEVAANEIGVNYGEFKQVVMQGRIAGGS